MQDSKAASKTTTVADGVEEKTRDHKDLQQQRFHTTPADTHTHITGLRGVLVVQSFIWLFFVTFIPALASPATDGPLYQRVLRDIFSVPLWNSTLIQNGFILLSMRTIAMSFLGKPTGQSFAATIIRRIVRLVILLCTASGIATLIYTQIGTEYVNQFKARLPNDSVKAPVEAYNAIAALNSLFDLFWLSSDFYLQAANSFWPSQTLWTSAIIYYQSFTVYFLMIILPYTRSRWHLEGLALFALGSFWMESWGWYSATGLYLADLAVNDDLIKQFTAGLHLRGELRMPYWIIGAIFTAVGLALKYFVTVLPQYVNSELVLHPFLDLSQNTSRASFAAEGPYPRLDDWLVLVGILIIVESFTLLKQALSMRPLLWLGDRSFSIFAAQCIVFWVAGIKLWLVLVDESGLSTAGANAIVLVTCTIAIAAFAELYHRTIDQPSKWLARHAYEWLAD